MTVVVLVEPGGLGGASRAALALALRLAEPADVVALSAGPAAGARGPAEARRLGAGRATLVVDPALEGADYPALGPALALAARRLGADLVLAGAASDGEGRGVLPAAVAHHLEAPFLSSLEDACRDGAGIVATVRAGGRVRRLEVSLPAVLTVTGTVAATAGNAGETDAADVLTLVDLGIEPATVARRLGLLGALEKPRRRAVTVKGIDDLVRRWLD